MEFADGSILAIAALTAFALPLPLVGQQHGFFHAVEYRDEAAGRVRIPGPTLEAVYAPSPQYTRQAQKAKVKAGVVVEGTLGIDGCVRDLKIVRSAGYGLDESAIQAVQRWRFTPFLKNGVPLQTMVEGELYFDPSWSTDRPLSKKKKCGEK